MSVKLNTDILLIYIICISFFLIINCLEKFQAIYRPTYRMLHYAHKLAS